MSDRPKMCANCGKLMGVGDTCPYCGADNRAVAVRAKRVMGRAAGEAGAMSVSGAIVTVNLFLYLTALVVGGVEQGGGMMGFLAPDTSVLFQLGLQYNPAIEAGQWWRLVTPIFLHLGLLHVLFNCYILWASGRLVEGEIGSRLMFLTYMLAGVVGFVASYYQGIGGGGASGAVAGMLGFMLVRRRLVDGHFRHPATVWVIQLVVLNAVFGLLATQVNNTAHLFGFLTGGAMALLLTKVRLSRLGAVALMLLTWTMAAVTVASFALMLLSAYRGGPDDFAEAQRCWIQVADVVQRPAFDPDRAMRARACLADAPRLEPEANQAAEQAARALGQGIEAWERGDSAPVARSLDAAAEAFKQYDRWRDEAAPRYAHR